MEFERSDLTGVDFDLGTDYRFHVSNKEEWMAFLDTRGYCVIECAADEEEVLMSRSLIWEDIERLYGVEKRDVSTWGKIPNGSAGILSKILPQTRGPWRIRALESVRHVFSSIWGTDELLVSMDSVLLWLPWWINKEWEPVSEGLHLDQNPFFKREKCCVQAMVPLLNVTEQSGGLEVVPFSHRERETEQFRVAHQQYSRSPSDFCVLRDKDKLSSPPVLLKAMAGDLILWDSRLLHGGRVGLGNSVAADAAAPELARISVPVCMTPRAFASASVQQRRRKRFQTGNTYTHWPHELVCTNLSSKSFIPVALSNRTMELV